MYNQKRSLLICFSFMILAASIGGCLAVKDCGTGDYDDLEDPLVLTISANQTSFTAAEDLTIPIWVKLENIDDRNYEINSVELRRSTLKINITDSSGDQVADFIGLVDSPPQQITIDPDTSIVKEFTVGGGMWIVTGITQETHFYFNRTGEYTLQVTYRNWAMENDDARRFDLVSNNITISITD